MKKKFSDITILIDIDDTIIDLLPAWCEWLNRKHGTNVLYENITEWDMKKFFPMLSKEQIYEPICNDDFWSTIKAKPDASEYIKKLIDKGFNIYLCTSTDYRNVKVKYEKVIKKYFPYILWNQIIVAYKKQMIKADFLIDDGVHNLENGEYVKILMSAPHNQNYDTEKNRMIRADNWKAIYNIIYNYEIVYGLTE